MSIAVASRKDFGVAEGEKLPDLSMVRVSDHQSTSARYSTPPGMFVDLAPVHVHDARPAWTTIGAEIGGDLRWMYVDSVPISFWRLTNPEDGLPESHWTGADVSRSAKWCSM